MMLAICVDHFPRLSRPLAFRRWTTSRCGLPQSLDEAGVAQGYSPNPSL